MHHFHYPSDKYYLVIRCYYTPEFMAPIERNVRILVSLVSDNRRRWHLFTHNTKEISLIECLHFIILYAKMFRRIELFSTYDQSNVQLDNENVLVEDDGGVEEDQVVQPQGNASDREYMTNLRDQIAQQLMQSG
ncbi:hypothetical protein Tco_0856349 [Tanacetum coccineum]|uniref:Uncharacterized protein n=1 Tax=Tanacetum coccineum TaxID=301880 RepID=A0ABQ5B5U2_9ASTR